MTIQLHPYISELLASRICHDIISPVGAINNGIELMQELGADDPDALDLVANSAAQASKRLKVYRFAYGAAGSKASADAREIRSTLFDYFEGARSTLEWGGNELTTVELPAGFVKTVLNLIILGSEIITRAGIIKVTQQGSGDTLSAQIQITGDKIAFKDGMLAAIEQTINPEDLDAKLIHAYMTSIFAKQYGLNIEKYLSEDKITFELSAK